MQYHPYSLLLLASAAITIFLAVSIRRRRTVPGADGLSTIGLAVFWWIVGYLLQTSSSGLSQQLFWMKLLYLGVVFIPPAWLVFTLRHFGWGGVLTRSRVALLSVIPAIVLLAVWTNDWHGLAWTGAWRNPDGLLQISRGPVFWLNVGYGYACVIASLAIIAWQLHRSARPARWQAATIFASGAIAWAGSLMHVTGLNPWPGLDPTPFAFILSDLAITFGFLHLRLLDLVPVAHSAVFASISDGAVVLDEYDRLVDLNPAAQAILKIDPGGFSGRSIAAVLPEWDDLIKGPDPVEISLGSGEDRSLYELRVSPLTVWRGKMAGRLIMLRDITARKCQEETERERRVNAEILRETAADLTSTLEMEEVLERILININRVAPHNGANVMRIEPDGAAVVVRSRGYAEMGVEKVLMSMRLQVAEMKNLREMFESGRPSWIADVRSDPKWVTLPETAWIRSYIGAPILVRGEVIGFINLDSAIPGFFTAGHAERMTVFAEQAAIAIENAHAYNEMRDLAVTDEVTGLYNRRKFFELGQLAVERAGITGQPVSVMVLDVDHFKSINDTSGHPVGDTALRTIAGLCRQNLRGNDIIGRYGGDEIVFLLSDCDTPTAQIIAERLCRAIAGTRIPAGNGQIQITASLGVSTLQGETLSLPILINRADQALLEAKQAGRNRVRIFAPA